MNVLKLVLEFIKVLIWPALVIYSLIIFRKQLSDLIDRLRKADLPGGVTLDFQKELKEAQVLSQQIAQIPEPKDKKNIPSIPLTEANERILSLGLQPSPSGLDMTYYRDIAKFDPNIALAGLRIELEIMGRNVAKGFKVKIEEQDSGQRIFRKLYDAGAITSEQWQLSQKIIQLCNAAVHGRLVSLDDVSTILELADVLGKQYIRWLSWGFGDNWKPKNSS